MENRSDREEKDSHVTRPSVTTGQAKSKSNPSSDPDEVTNANNNNNTGNGNDTITIESPQAKPYRNSLLLQEAASKDGGADVAESLLAGGASLDCKDGKDADRTPLHKACATGTVGMIRFLALHGRSHGIHVTNVKDASGSTPLHIVAERDWGVMEEDEGVEEEEEEEDKGVGAAMELLRHGADVDDQNNTGKTALHMAATAGNVKIAEYLMRMDASVNISNALGQTALHLCYVGGSVEMIPGLIRYGAPIDAKDHWGRTALHEACRHGWKQGVEALLSQEPNTSLKDDDGLTALQLAKDAGAGEIVQLFADWGVKGSTRSWRQRRRSSSLPRSLSSGRVRRSDAKGVVSRERTVEETYDNGDSEPETSATELRPESRGSIWAGVSRENGDGFMLASYNKHDISFAAKLESICPCVHEGKDMHEIQIKLNFMRPYSMDHRIRYAKVDVTFGPADRMEVSEQEISSGQKFTVGAGGGGGPSNVNISMEGSKSKTATFKGVRIIHGAIQDKTHASWRLYEEPGSKSGLPEIVRLLLVVHCNAGFEARLGLSVTACHFLTFGIPRTLRAPAGPSYKVPELGVIAAYEQESRLKQVLDVVDRAATVVEEAKKLEEMFARAMRGHEKRGLIMEAGTKENHLQEWTDILDDSKSSDFRALKEKLVEIDESTRGTRRRRVRESTPPVQRHDNRSSNESRIEESPYRAYGSRKVGYYDDDGNYHRLNNSRYRRDGYYESNYYDEGYGRGDPYTSRRGNALQSFSAVGPGYHVSRLA